MNIKQLYEKLNGQYIPFYPLTDLKSIIDEGGNDFVDILLGNNHIFINSGTTQKEARLAVPDYFRRKAICITYIIDGEVITETYTGTASVKYDSNWLSNRNWTREIDENRVLELSKIPDNSIGFTQLAPEVKEYIDKLLDSEINTNVHVTVVGKTDEEDLTTTATGVIKFANRKSNSDTNEIGYRILRKNNIDGNMILTQEMLKEENCIYEIRYDFDLDNKVINIPYNSILRFNGGSFKNGIINGINCTIEAGDYVIFKNIILKGAWKQIVFKSAWFTGGDNQAIPSDAKNSVVVIKGHYRMNENNFGKDFVVESIVYDGNIEDLKNSEKNEVVFQIIDNLNNTIFGVCAKDKRFIRRGNNTFISNEDNDLIEIPKLTNTTLNTSTISNTINKIIDRLINHGFAKGTVNTNYNIPEPDVKIQQLYCYPDTTDIKPNDSFNIVCNTANTDLYKDVTVEILTPTILGTGTAPVIQEANYTKIFNFTTKAIGVGAVAFKVPGVNVSEVVYINCGKQLVNIPTVNVPSNADIQSMINTSIQNANIPTTSNIQSIANSAANNAVNNAIRNLNIPTTSDIDDRVTNKINSLDLVTSEEMSTAIADAINGLEIGGGSTGGDGLSEQQVKTLINNAINEKINANTNDQLITKSKLLADYYTKTEVDNLLSSIVAPEGTTLSIYCDKPSGFAEETGTITVICSDVNTPITELVEMEVKTTGTNTVRVNPVVQDAEVKNKLTANFTYINDMYGSTIVLFKFKSSPNVFASITLQCQKVTFKPITNFSVKSGYPLVETCILNKEYEIQYNASGTGGLTNKDVVWNYTFKLLDGTTSNNSIEVEEFMNRLGLLCLRFTAKEFGTLVATVRSSHNSASQEYTYSFPEYDNYDGIEINMESDCYVTIGEKFIPTDAQTNYIKDDNTNGFGDARCLWLEEDNKIINLGSNIGTRCTFQALREGTSSIVITSYNNIGVDNVTIGVNICKQPVISGFTIAKTNGNETINKGGMINVSVNAELTVTVNYSNTTNLKRFIWTRTGQNIVNWNETIGNNTALKMNKTDIHSNNGNVIKIKAIRTGTDRIECRDINNVLKGYFLIRVM